MDIGELVSGIDIGATHVRLAIYNPANWELVGQISNNRIKHATSRLQISPDEFKQLRPKRTNTRSCYFSL